MWLIGTMAIESELLADPPEGIVVMVGCDVYGRRSWRGVPVDRSSERILAHATEAVRKKDGWRVLSAGRCDDTSIQRPAARASEVWCPRPELNG